MPVTEGLREREGLSMRVIIRTLILVLALAGAGMSATVGVRLAAAQNAPTGTFLPGELIATGIDGSAYLIGGFGMTALTINNIIVVPIRSGVGLRLGANVGYLKFTPSATWNPF